VTTEEKRDIFW